MTTSPSRATAAGRETHRVPPRDTGGKQGRTSRSFQPSAKLSLSDGLVRAAEVDEPRYMVVADRAVEVAALREDVAEIVLRLRRARIGGARFGTCAWPGSGAAHRPRHLAPKEKRPRTFSDVRGLVRPPRRRHAAAGLSTLDDHGVPLSTECPVSWRRPRPGRPAAAFTAPEVVGPMQKSAARVGLDWWLTGGSALPVAMTVSPMLPLSKHSRNRPRLQVSPHAPPLPHWTLQSAFEVQPRNVSTGAQN